MTGTTPLRTRISSDPAQLSEAERNYYRATWGFDPVGDCQSLGENKFRHEACLSLEQDPPLHSASVTICARVDWQAKAIHNRIVFRRDVAEASVECTHTMIFAGPLEDALTYATDVYSSGDRLTPADREMLRRAGGPVALPPWEHFVALKSYVAALAEMGIVNLLRASSLTRTAKEDELPFGFNADMHLQVARALRVVAPEAVDTVFRDEVRGLLETVPPEWIITRWGILVEAYPLEEVCYNDPGILLAWLARWARGAGPWLLPSEVNQDVGKWLEGFWVFVLRAWDAETFTRWCRQSNAFDALQSLLFSHFDPETPPCLTAEFRPVSRDDPTCATDVVTAFRDVPWIQLWQEWRAREAARDFADGNSWRDGSPWKQWESQKNPPPAEVWPRAHFLEFEFPAHLLPPATGPSVNLAARRARVQQYLCEVQSQHPIPVQKAGYDKDFHRQMLAWAGEFEDQLEVLLAIPFPHPAEVGMGWVHKFQIPQLESPNPEIDFPSQNLAGFTELIRTGDAEHRRAAALAANLPETLQQELVSHWDFATRLALAANPEITAPILDQLTQDVQPSIRAVARARQVRKTPHITPLMGEVLTPGELLWFLAAHPTVFFRFGVTTWGDGSEAYAEWFVARLREDDQGKQAIGDYFNGAYAEGLFCRYGPEDYRGYRATHLALTGWGHSGYEYCAIGHLPCMYLGIVEGYACELERTN